ncbi:MAG: hypothetical protein IH936_08570 [Acidobacteria bacterium]|nr:hypothetical protein [Acidobacteriota bacterium]
MREPKPPGVTVASARPLGSEGFVDRLERVTGQRLRPQKAGREPREK